MPGFITISESFDSTICRARSTNIPGTDEGFDGGENTIALNRLLMRNSKNQYNGRMAKKGVVCGSIVDAN